MTVIGFLFLCYFLLYLQTILSVFVLGIHSSGFPWVHSGVLFWPLVASSSKQLKCWFSQWCLVYLRFASCPFICWTGASSLLLPLKGSSKPQWIGSHSVLLIPCWMLPIFMSPFLLLWNLAEQLGVPYLIVSCMVCAQHAQQTSGPLSESWAVYNTLQIEPLHYPSFVRW